MMQAINPNGAAQADWSFACHLSYGDEGSVCVVSRRAGRVEVRNLPVGVRASAVGRPPVFLGVDSRGEAVTLDPASKAIAVAEQLPADAFAAYAYRDAEQNHAWFMYDGDKETGCDELNCGASGSSVTVIDAASGRDMPRYLQTICVGRGHHVTTFVGPVAAFPDIPRRAFVSNLKDGSITVVGNDPADPQTYLKVVETINLCEPEKEDFNAAAIPNNAFPHGKVFSAHTGRIYSLNNGYGSIAVINPVSNCIEGTIALKLSSNLLLSPDGRFIIGKGADRKTDPDHVLGRLTVVDAVTGSVEGILDLPDLYPSTYRFTPDGARLYVTSAATGKGAQRDNLKKDVVQIFDTAALPELRVIKEITVGRADCSRRPIAFVEQNGQVQTVLIPNPTDGSLTLLGGADDEVRDTIKISDGPVGEFSFSLWDGRISGC